MGARDTLGGDGWRASLPNLVLDQGAVALPHVATLIAAKEVRVFLPRGGGSLVVRYAITISDAVDHRFELVELNNTLASA